MKLYEINFMKFRVLLVAIALFVGSLCSYGQLLQWNTFGNSGTETTEPSVTNDVNVAAANLTFGSGLTAAGNGNRFGGNNWFDTGNTVAGNTLTEAIAGNNFIQFTVTSNSGFSFTPTSFVFGFERSNTGPSTLALRSSVDAYATNIGAVAVAASLSTPTAYTITISGLTNITTATTFRLYGFGATLTTGTGGFDQGGVSPGVVNVVLNGTTSLTGITSTQNGAWSSATTWVGGVVPTSSQNVIIAHNVTTGAITRDSGTTTTINTGANLAVSGNYTNNGTTNVNGTFQIDQGGFGGGAGTYTYGDASALVYNHTSGVYGPIDSFHSYWPATNSPFNVSVLNSGSGGINIGVARTVAGTFATAAGVTLTSSSLTLNGTCQINGGGFFSNSPPIYGSSSTLVYNASFNVGNEWTGNSTTAGTGIPQNVTIQNSASVSMPNGNRGMAGNLNITSGSLTLNATSGDLYVVGNWTRASTATFTPNNRAVFFNGTTNQTVTVTPTGTETFNFLLVEGSGTLQLATGTNVVVTSSSGLTLTSSNVASTINLNGQTLTLSGGGNLNLNTGTRRITSTVANGRLVLSAGVLTITNGGSLSAEANTIVDLGAGLDSGIGSLLTINGTLQINLNGFCNSNSPKYGASSLLQYNRSGIFGRGFEWLALGVGTIGTTPGYPNNIQISNNTTLNYNNGMPLAKAINGNLTVDAGSSFYMDFGGNPSGGFLTVAGNVINNGNFTLGNASGDDLKLGGNFSNGASGVFNGKDRAIYFLKVGLQTISNLSSTTLTIPYVVLSGGTTVQLNNNLIISAPAGGNAISYTSATDVIDINGNSLTIGTAATANIINGSGSFKGSTTSNLTLLGTGSVGTLNFTSGSQVLGNLTLNRQASNIGFDLGTGLTINGTLALTNGIANLSNQTLIITLAGSISGASPLNYIIADFTAGGSLRKNFTNGTGTASSFTFPIGDSAASADGMQYSPATINFTTANYSSGWAALAVQDTAEPNIGSPPAFITRYWRLTSSGITTATYDFTGTYLSVDITGIEINCKSGRYSTSNNTWTDGANLVPGTNTVSLVGLTSATGALTDPNHFTASFRNQEISIRGGINNIINGSTSATGSNNTLFSGTNLYESSIKNYEIQNLGIATLNLTGTPIVTIGGVNFNDFSISAAPLNTIAGGSSTAFSITFSPTSLGIRTAIVSISNNDSDESPYTFIIQGTGTCPVSTNTITPTSGPVGTEITITSSNSITNSLTGAMVTFNGVAAAPVTIVSSTLIRVSVPPLAISGNLITTNAQGCLTTNAFTVIDNKANTCQGGNVAPDLFISELTDATVGGLSYVEIYNGSSSTINMSGYSLKIYSNGDTSLPTSLPLINYVLNPGNVFVVALGTTTSVTTSNTCSITGGNGQLANQTSTSGGVNFDTSNNDYIGLYKNGTTSIIDSFGTFGSNNWADGLGLGDRGVTFRRKNNVTVPKSVFVTTDWNITDWGGSSQESCNTNDYSDIGIYNFISGAPPIITIQPSYTPTCKSTSLMVAGTEGYNGNSPPDTNEIVYQWFVSAANATGWTEISSTTDGSIYTNFNTATLNISNISGILNSQFYCQIRENTNTCFAATTAVKITDGGGVTWNGVDWRDASNAISTPTIGKLAIINGAFNTATHGSFDACSLVVNSPYTVYINPDDYINIQYDLTVNLGGNLIVQNNGSLVQIDDNGVNTGIISMQRTPTILRSTDYIYWSSPVSNFPVAQVSPASWLIYKWIPTILRPYTSNFGGWLACYGDTMLPGKGYIIRGLDTVTATFTNDASHGSGVVNNGVINVGIERSTYDGPDYTYLSGSTTLTVNKDNDNYNLLGNPYTSAIDADTFLTVNTNIEGHVRLWSHGTAISASNGQSFYNGFVLTYTASDYVFWNKLGPSTGPQAFNGKIAAGQGFFVTMNQSSASTAESITFNNSMRNKGYNNSNFFRTSNASKPNRIWLDITNDTGNSIRTLVGYDKDATIEKDRMYDAKINLESNLNIYSLIDTEPQIIQGRPMPFDKDDKVYLGIVIPAKSSNSAPSASTYKIGIAFVDGIFNKENQDIFLEDKLLNSIHDLRKEPYVFTSNAGRFDDRFVLRYTKTSLGINDFNSSKNNVIVATSDAQIKVKSNKEDIKSVAVYDVLGREIYYKDNINFRALNIKEIKSFQQALIIKVVLENGQIVSKKIIF